MNMIDGFIWACIGGVVGFFFGMTAAVIFIAHGRDDDGETS